MMMTTTTEQLQQIGLNKYEAEAYYTLLKHGPLTGYEVGKHSQVPLSRSYDVLERLVDKGLVSVQPGEPSRYNAQDPQQFLGQVRSTMEETLSALTVTLTTLSYSHETDEFWVIRGRQNIIERSQEIIARAHDRLELSIPASCEAVVAEGISQARQRGVSIVQSTDHTTLTTENIMVMSDGHQALLGVLMPAQLCQAIVSSNAALIAVLQGYFEPMQRTPSISTNTTIAETDRPDVEWMDWETRKHARLLRLSERSRVA